jgi:hypothetical protein
MKRSDIQATIIPACERWLGSRAGWDGSDEDESASNDRISDFQIDAGNDTWGDPKCVIGALDTPVITGKRKFSLNKLLVSVSESNARYRIRFAWGSSYAAAIQANTFVEIEIFPIDKKASSDPVAIGTPRVAVGTKFFAACWAGGENTATIDFTIAIHEFSN